MAQMVKNLPAVQETQVSWVGKIPWRRECDFKNEGQIKTFLDKQAEECVTTMPALQEMVKQAHQVEIKR